MCVCVCTLAWGAASLVHKCISVMVCVCVVLGHSVHCTAVADDSSSTALSGDGGAVDYGQSTRAAGTWG